MVTKKLISYLFIFVQCSLAAMTEAEEARLAEEMCSEVMSNPDATPAISCLRKDRHNRGYKTSIYSAWVNTIASFGSMALIAADNRAPKELTRCYAMLGAFIATISGFFGPSYFIDRHSKERPPEEIEYSMLDSKKILHGGNLVEQELAVMKIYHTRELAWENKTSPGWAWGGSISTLLGAIVTVYSTIGCGIAPNRHSENGTEEPIPLSSLSVGLGIMVSGSLMSILEAYLDQGEVPWWS